MTSIHRYVAVASIVVLAGVLMACGTSATPGPSSPSGSSPAGTGAPSSPASTPPATQPPSPTATGEVDLVEGATHRMCGIDVGVKFIPPMANAKSQDQAFLVVGNGSSGDQPLPGAVAPARAGSVATVMGKRFAVVSVDLARKRVTVRALC
jgi:hypothetical protein